MPQHPALSEGRVAVITGGASGIGLAAANRFASMGMRICLADLSRDVLDRAGGRQRRYRADRCQQDRGFAAPQGPRLCRIRRGRRADEQRGDLAGRRAVGSLRSLAACARGQSVGRHQWGAHFHPSDDRPEDPVRDRQHGLEAGALPARRETLPTTSPRPG